MRAALGLMRHILHMPFPWNAWVALMSGVNMIGGFVYVRTPEGLAVLVSLTVAFVIMTAIYSRYGFVSLLGVGHIVCWTPLLVFLGHTLATDGAAGWFRYWIWTVVALNGVSLMIDVVDVARFARGERLQIDY